MLLKSALLPDLVSWGNSEEGLTLPARQRGEAVREELEWGMRVALNADAPFGAREEAPGATISLLYAVRP